MKPWSWLAAAILLALGALGAAQQAAPKAAPGAGGSRFNFEVIESFDAKYEGDTPGHIGKSGGLGERRPHVALGDPVFRGDEKIGIVTGLVWSRAQGSLQVEFDPVGDVRVCVGDEVWLALDGKPN
jgi:hypothetical protein